MFERLEKLPWESKKFRAYLIGDVSWTALLLVALGGLYWLVSAGVLDGPSLVQAIQAISSVLIVFAIAKLVMSGTYIGGQSWVDQATRVALIAARSIFHTPSPPVEPSDENESGGST